MDHQEVEINPITPGTTAIDAEILENENKIRSLESQVIRNQEVRYILGLENRVAGFEKFQELPVKVGYSWGSGMGTTSFKWKGEDVSEEEVRENIDSVLEPLDIEYPGVFHMTGAFEGPQEQFEIVSSSDLDLNVDETIVKANCIFTYDKNVRIVIRPADCNISVIYAKTKDGRDISGFVHSSGLSTNAGIPRSAISWLIDTQGVDISSIRIGITPGIKKENYSMAEVENIKLDEELTGKLLESREKPTIIERNWKDHIDPKKTDDPKERRQVDIIGATIMQFLEAGILPSQIDVHDVDTYEANKKGESFSNRLYEELMGNGLLFEPGRFMVALQLKDE